MQKQIAYLRELAKKQLDFSESLENKSREKMWYAHNSLDSSLGIPVVIEEDSFINSVGLNLQCEDSFLRELEFQIKKNIWARENIDDDKVTPNEISLYPFIDINWFGIHFTRICDSKYLGYHTEKVIEIIENDIQNISHSEYHYKKQETENRIEIANNILGDILPVRLINAHNMWLCSITPHVLDLMGMENMFCSMLNEPDEFHKLMRFMTDDIKNLLRFEEEQEIIYLNNKNDYMGSGSYCFNNELNKCDAASGKVLSKNTWGHLNSQESVGISPELFDELIFPYYEELSREFGFLYYGCCEPVSDFWDTSLYKLKNLRKISISHWCDAHMMGQRLEDKNIIFSLKPAPQFLGVTKEFDCCGFTDYMRDKLKYAKKCKKEVIFRDVYDLHGNIKKLKQVLEITKKVLEE